MPETTGFTTGLKYLTGRVIRALFPDALLTEEGEAQVRKLGHRRYIGGNWDDHSKALFDFLLAQGLQPDHVLLDIACGSLRLGVKAIPYLDRGNYLGLDREASLIEAGLAHELDPQAAAARQPEFVISSTFEFEKFSRRPDLAIAHSLFTHLIPPDIDRCLAQLRKVLKSDGRFFVSFRESNPLSRNPSRSNSFASFRYSRAEMVEFARRNGFSADYLGEWHAGSVQMMMVLRPIHA